MGTALDPVTRQYLISEIKRSSNGRKLLREAADRERDIALVWADGRSFHRNGAIHLDRRETGDSLLLTFAHELHHRREWRTTYFDPTVMTKSDFLTAILREEVHAEALAATIMMQRDRQAARAFDFIDFVAGKWENRYSGENKNSDSFFHEAAHYQHSVEFEYFDHPEDGDVNSHVRRYAAVWEEAQRDTVDRGGYRAVPEPGRPLPALAYPADIFVAAAAATNSAVAPSVRQWVVSDQEHSLPRFTPSSRPPAHQPRQG